MASTVALVAVGSLGKYVCEAIVADARFNVVVLSRQVGFLFLNEHKRVLTNDLLKTEPCLV
jgi:hypothetical protein